MSMLYKIKLCPICFVKLLNGKQYILRYHIKPIRHGNAVHNHSSLITYCSGVAWRRPWPKTGVSCSKTRENVENLQKKRMPWLLWRVHKVLHNVEMSLKDWLEIRLRGKQRTIYSTETLQLMTWRRKAPGHEQTWCLLKLPTRSQNISQSFQY